MSSREKRRQRIEQNPKQVRFEDLDLLLRDYDFQVRRPRRGGSHYFYFRGCHVLSIAKQRPQLKEYVVRRALAILQVIDTEETNPHEKSG